ncbi:hypothetical protein Dsin_027952 [Dipteronia sinensis]|uniref:C-JID domain-containing protein n=1 Tax=Dipteronia sinensis TaxID=43782 RepID=A0AAD9ZRB8_9ROSI|nr:hypothetical protein Dsin_027952 [Dipteronia sinensis]
MLSTNCDKLYDFDVEDCDDEDCDEDYDEDCDEEDCDEDYDEDCDEEDCDEVHLRNDDLDYLPDELRYLHWKRYPLEILPSVFNPVNLVELDLSHSNIQQLWEGRTCVPKLKRLNLFRCENLIRIPDLTDIPSAESIILASCISLLEIHSSRECPKNLHSLPLSNCINLISLPSNIHLEGSEFSLSGCISLTKFPHISGNIKRLDLSGSLVEEVPSTIQSLSKLEGLIMTNCTRLKRISKSICKLKSLDRLHLSGCCKLESFPDMLEGMELKYLNLSGTTIKELPPSIGNLNRLEELFLSGCKNLEKLPPLSGLCSLNELRLNNSNLTEISEDIGCLSSLQKLDLHGNVFERLPKSIKQLSKLYYLSLYNCVMLRSLPELPSSVRYLEAMNCKELIQSLPDESAIELCADGGGSFIFNFMNCLTLNQKAVSNLFQNSIEKMELMGTEKIFSLFKVSPPPFPPSPFCSITPPDEEAKAGICLPGSEIPEWFCYKNIGSSIIIPDLRNDCGSYIMGFAVCLVIGFEECFVDFDQGRLNVSYNFHIETSDGHKGGVYFAGGFQIWPVPHTELIGSDHIVRTDFFTTLVPVSHRDGHKEGFFHYSIAPFIIRPDEHNGLICSDHILLGYNLSRKCYEFFQELDSMSGYMGTSFKFNLEQMYPSSNGVKACEVKHCGIRPICVQAHVMNSVAINQDTEETCESDTKRICTEANQCS